MRLYPFAVKDKIKKHMLAGPDGKRYPEYPQFKPNNPRPQQGQKLPGMQDYAQVFQAAFQTDLKKALRIKIHPFLEVIIQDMV